MKLITKQCSAASLLPSPYELQEFVAALRPQRSYCVIPSVREQVSKTPNIFSLKYLLVPLEE